MKNYKQQFIMRTNEVFPDTPKYEVIKDQVVYPKEEMKEPKKYFFVRFALAPVLVVMLLVFVSFGLSREKEQKALVKAEKEVLNAPLEVKVDEQLSDSDIYINYPMMYTGCDLTNRISSNANWDLYENGKLVDKHGLSLSRGVRTYQIKFYRGDKELKSCNIQIKVGN